jgi:formylmethanofuran dehydrogenase subunit E
MANNKTEFFTKYRMLCVAPTKVPDEVVEPLVNMVMNAPEDKIMTVSEVFTYEWPKETHSFDGFVCEECGEMVVEQYGRIKGNKKVCIDCANK